MAEERSGALCCRESETSTVPLRDLCAPLRVPGGCVRRCGKLLLIAGARCSAAAAPKFAPKVLPRGCPWLPVAARGLGDLRDGSRATWLLPLGRAVTSRLHSLGVPDRKITAKGGLGKGGGWLQDKVGGLISRAKKTLPSCPGLLGKLWEQKQGAVRDSPSRSLWEAEINRVWSQPGLSVTSDTAGILVSSCKGELLTKLLNFLTPVFKDKSVRGVTVAI